MSVTSDLEQFVVGIAEGSGVGSVDPGDDLLAQGIIDSHGLVELVGFIEQRYGIKVADEDLLPENFQSLASIEAFIARKAA